MTEHARLSPSGAERWMVCPGAPRMEDRFDDETSEYSSEGTAAHTVREMCFTHGFEVTDLVGQLIQADGLFFEVTLEWAHYLQPGIDRVRESKADWVFEYRVVMDPWIPGGFGTLDTGGILPDLIIIDDLKFGKGIIVEAEKNKQLMIYALGFWENYAKALTKAKQFLLRIDQPRVTGQGSEWYVSLDELLAFGDEVKAAVARVSEADAAPEDDLIDFLNPTPKGCQFCRAARNSACPKLDQFVVDLLGLKITDLNTLKKRVLKMANIDELTPERRSYILENKSLISSWLNNLHANALNAAIQGDEVPGFKAVNTEGDRAWADLEAAEQFWESKMPAKEIYDRKLKSPAQMEKIAGTRNWAKAQGLIVRAEGRPALVPLSDKRPAIIPLVDLLDELDDMDDDDQDDLIGITETPDISIYDDLI